MPLNLLISCRSPPDVDPDRVSRFAQSFIHFPVSIHISLSDYRLPAPPSAPGPGGAAGDGSGPPAKWPQTQEFLPHSGKVRSRGDRRSAGSGTSNGCRHPPFRSFQGVLGPCPSFGLGPCRGLANQRLSGTMQKELGTVVTPAPVQAKPAVHANQARIQTLLLTAPEAPPSAAPCSLDTTVVAMPMLATEPFVHLAVSCAGATCANQPVAPLRATKEASDLPATDSCASPTEESQLLASTAPACAGPTAEHCAPRPRRISYQPTPGPPRFAAPPQSRWISCQPMPIPPALGPPWIPSLS